MTSYLEEEGRAILTRLNDEPTVALSVDTETRGLRVAAGFDICIGVSIAGLFEDGTPFAHYFGLRHEHGKNISQETEDMLEWVLIRQEHTLIFCNVQFDLLSLATVGIYAEHTDFIDICTMAHLIDENMPKSKSLDSLALHYLGESGKIVDPYIEKQKLTGNHEITPEEMFDYAVMDAVSTWRIWDDLVTHPRWLALPENIWPDKQDFVRVLLEMKRRGVRIDTELSMEMVKQGEAEQKRLAKELGYPAVPKRPTKMHPNPDPDPLPVLGPTALKEIFIDKLGLPVVKASTKTGKPSFDKDVMAEYDIILERLDSPEAKLVKSYRGWQKAVSAAYKPYLALLEPDGRLRCSYKMHGTVTGRLSCIEPNLQQVPKASDKPWNGKVKECFIAEEGYTLINADFSQLELRLATAYSGEPELTKVFEEGRDIFTEMSEALGFTRQDTKTLVYSMQYGAGLPRIMNVFGVSKERAIEIRSTYFNTYPLFKVLADRCTANAEATLEHRLWNGRYRHFQYKSEAFKAMNSVIQGGAADIVERCMVYCFQNLDNDDCRMLLQVHDSITWEVRTELVDEYMPRIKETMEAVTTYTGRSDFNVRFAVDVDYWTDRERAKHEDIAA